MKQLDVRILQNEKVAGDFYRIRLESAYLAKHARPGQFIEVRCSDGSSPLLRKPFSVHRILKDGIELLYEVVGEGTGLLSKKKKRQFLDIIGPLGNSFTLKPAGGRQIILVAGGIGVAPLVALAENVERIAYRKKSVIIGAKSKSHILCERDFKKLGFETLIATEDGSLGKKGLATELLKKLLSTVHHPPSAAIYTCGPRGMLKEVASIARSGKIPCQVSLEEYMACGIGVCLGCPVKVNAPYGYKMVCKDGPVFNAEEIVWQ